MFENYHVAIIGASVKGRRRMASYQPRLHHRRSDERRKQRMRLEGARLQFGMELHPDEPGMSLIFHDLWKTAARRQARETQAMLLQPILVRSVDLITVAVALRDLGGSAIDFRHPAAALEQRGIGAQPDGPAEVAVF